MSTTDLAKDAIRIATTAGLSKDVIDLLEKKLALMTEEGLFFKESLAKSIAENDALKLKVKNLEDQIHNLAQMGDGLDKECEDILFLFFETDSEFSVDRIAAHFKMHPSVAKAHFDTLAKNEFIDAPCQIVFDDGPHPPPRFHITADGREYAMKRRKK